MTSSRRFFAYSAMVATIALLGAGCANSTNTDTSSPLPGSSPTPTSTATPTPSTPSSPSNSVPSGSNEYQSTITASSTLDTTGWQDYTNKTLGFSFKYPIRGSYAPEFTVKLLPLTSPEIVNDCVATSSASNSSERRVTVNGTAFCRTSGVKEGGQISEDVWVTKTPAWFAVITFTKAHPTERPFNVDAYNRQLEAILSTFTPPSGN